MAMSNVSDATESARKGLPEFLLLGAVCWTLFVNHYARDVTGALELQIMDYLGTDPESLQLLNSVFFAPNLISPILSGMLAHRFGGVKVLVGAACVAVVGNVLVAVGCTLASYDAVLAGRLVLGCVYEAIDILPFPILVPYFFDRWGLVMGTLAACLRLGSVGTFTFSPLLYQAGGLPAATWTSCALGATGLIAACAALQLEQRHFAGVTSKEEDEEERGAEAEDGVKSTRGCAAVTRGTSRGDLARFAVYLCVGALTWGCIAPWWFFGQGYITLRWQDSLQVADALMFLPEAIMVILSPAVGLAVDRLTTRARAATLAGCLSGVVAAFALLALPPPSALTPWVPIVILGLSYASSSTIFMSLSAALIPGPLMALGSGALGCSLNLLPAALPVVMGSMGSQQIAIMWLLGTAALATLAALLLLAAVLGGAPGSEAPAGEGPAPRPTEPEGAEQIPEVQAV